MKSVLFVKKSRKVSGGHIKFRDYFQHCLQHPDLDPYAYLAFNEEYGAGTLWEGERDRLVTRMDVWSFDYLFIDGRDWELIPETESLPPVMHLIQDFRHGDIHDPRFNFLSRRAWRICVGQELAEAVEPYANGPVAVIPNGVDAGVFRPGVKQARSVVVWARKDRERGKEIAAALKQSGATVHLLTKPIPRREWAAILAGSEVFVGLTKEREGFFLPALEAMASGCAVVCADAIGNRGFCIDEVSCLIAEFGSVADHVRCTTRLLSDTLARDGIAQRGVTLASDYTLDRERVLFWRLVDDQVIVGAAAT